jgi:hypothetical protein
MVTTTSKNTQEKCRFDLFVRLKDNVPNKFPNGERARTFRGDHYEKTKLDKMLAECIRIVRKEYHLFKLIHLRDNAKPDNDKDHVVFHYTQKGGVEKNIITDYKELLIDIRIPEIMMYEIRD